MTRYDIIPFDSSDPHLRSRFIRTKSCSGCGMGAAVVLKDIGQPPRGSTFRNKAREDFLAGIAARLVTLECICDDTNTSLPEFEYWKWRTESFK